MQATAEQDTTPIDRLASVKNLDWWVFGVLALLTFLTYLPVIGTGLLSDDWGLVYPKYNPWPSWHGHWFFGGEGTYYRPLSRLLIYYTAAFFGTSGIVHHIVSILLHVGCGLFLFLGLKRLGRPVAGLIGAGVAMLHPAAVEAVGWVASQTDLLVMFFFLGTLAASIGPLNPKRYALSAGFAALAYLSKDTAILLGPSMIGACVYVLVLVRPLPESRRRILGLAGLHLVLWIAYMFVRKIFLGQFIYDSADISIAQMTANLMAVLNEFLWPIGRLFDDRGFLHKETIPFFAEMLALPALFFWCLAPRRHIAAIAIAMMCLGIGPYMKALDVTLRTGGGERFFYHPLWFFSVLCGLLLEPAFRVAWQKRAYLGIGAVVALLVARTAFLTGSELDDFRRAALVRGQIASELERSVLKAANPIVVIERYPDRIGGAFVFRNGFPDFLNMMSDREIEAVMVSDLTPEKLKPGMQVFRFNFVDEGSAPIIQFDSTMTRLAMGTTQDEAGRPKAPPLIFDFSNQDVRRLRFAVSPDMKFTQANADGSFRFEISGSDPNIGVPLPQTFDHSGYATAFIEFALPDAPNQDIDPEIIDAIFQPIEPNAAPVTVSMTLPIEAGRQRIEFNTGNTLSWRATQGLGWFRFDPGSQYRGRIDIYRMGFE